MKKQPLILRFIAIANAVLVTAAFVGCPARRDAGVIVNPIAPPPPPFVTIAPYGGNFQQLVPSDEPTAPAGQGSKSDKRSP
jgi:hypothetical protein